VPTVRLHPSAIADAAGSDHIALNAHHAAAVGSRLDSTHVATSRASHTSLRPILTAGAKRPSCRSHRTVSTETRKYSATSAIVSNLGASSTSSPLATDWLFLVALTRPLHGSVRGGRVKGLGELPSPGPPSLASPAPATVSPGDLRQTLDAPTPARGSKLCRVRARCGGHPLGRWAWVSAQVQQVGGAGEASLTGGVASLAGTRGGGHGERGAGVPAGADVGQHADGQGRLGSTSRRPARTRTRRRW
jgi:hypothetical protein